MVQRKHIIGLVLAVIVLSIIGMVLLLAKLTSSTADRNQHEVKHIHPPNTLSSILLSTSTASVHQPKKEKQVRSSPSKCTAKYRNKPKWSVTVEACTKNIGSPFRVIKEWQFKDKNQAKMSQRYRLHKNGSFCINERGTYLIYTQVTFKDDERSNYIVDMFGSSSSKKLDSETQVNTKNGERVVVFEFCGNITERLSFFLKLPNASLVYLFPEKTYFVVKKME